MFIEICKFHFNSGQLTITLWFLLRSMLNWGNGFTIMLVLKLLDQLELYMEVTFLPLWKKYYVGLITCFPIYFADLWSTISTNNTQWSFPIDFFSKLRTNFLFHLSFLQYWSDNPVNKWKLSTSSLIIIILETWEKKLSTSKYEISLSFLNSVSRFKYSFSIWAWNIQNPFQTPLEGNFFLRTK